MWPDHYPHQVVLHYSSCQYHHFVLYLALRWSDQLACYFFMLNWHIHSNTCLPELRCGIDSLMLYLLGLHHLYSQANHQLLHMALRWQIRLGSHLDLLY